MQLVIAFLGCENVVFVDYDQKFLLPLLIETNKMLMPTDVIKVTIYNHKVILISNHNNTLGVATLTWFTTKCGMKGPMRPRECVWVCDTLSQMQENARGETQ